MDRAQEELQFVGFFGILKQSFKIITKWKTIFTQISLVLILPLSFIYLAHMHISQILFSKISNNQTTLTDETPVGTPGYSKLSHQVSSQWAAFFLFKVAYFTIFVILFLLSTSAVVYTIACIYTAKEITFKKVMSVVPRVWKRLMITFLWNYAMVFVYNVVAFGVLVLLTVFIGFAPVGIALLLVFLILYLAGLVYITIVWNLASVVSVLEDIRGIKAMTKSKALIKGKMGVAIAIIVLLTIGFVGTAFLYESIVVVGVVRGVAIRIGVGIICFVMLFLVILIGLVLQTVLYFVCKSYHHENIDKVSLSDHLEAYLGHYVSLNAATARDVQLEQLRV
ncbi:hypothetical protein CFOL_v3_00720 [Cephalotus follicularis]|uniref:Uncharacterized protein n=1 Tax=Cephalotus follicularis TaxID=3775 RepID=A0A1Q3ANN8_CEPFO|nr:hypothetical protein CFOL_v3_00720 [Cephalotus follicularis]